MEKKSQEERDGSNVLVQPPAVPALRSLKQLCYLFFFLHLR